MPELKFSTIRKLVELLTSDKWLIPPKSKKDRKIAILDKIQEIKDKIALLGLPNDQLPKVEKSKQLKQIERSHKSLEILEQELVQAESDKSAIKCSAENVKILSNLDPVTQLEITKRTKLTRSEALLLLQNIDHLSHLRGLVGFNDNCLKELILLLLKEFFAIVGSDSVWVNSHAFTGLNIAVECNEKLRPYVIVTRVLAINFSDDCVKKLHLWFNHSLDEMLFYLEKSVNYSSSMRFQRAFIFNAPDVDKLGEEERRFWYRINKDFGRFGVSMFSYAVQFLLNEKFKDILKYGLIGQWSQEDKDKIRNGLEEIAVTMYYIRAKENQRLAKIFHEFLIAEEIFNLALDFIKKNSVDENKLFTKISDLLPDITFEFEVRGNKYKFQKLPAGDYRGFILGKYTECCQTIGKGASQCVEEGMTKQCAGFYILTNDKGRIVAQSYAWLAKDNKLILDSFEYVGSDPELFIPTVSRLSQELDRAKPSYSLFVGSSYSGIKIEKGKKITRPEPIDKTLHPFKDSLLVHFIEPIAVPKIELQQVVNDNNKKSESLTQIINWVIKFDDIEMMAALFAGMDKKQIIDTINKKYYAGKNLLHRAAESSHAKMFDFIFAQLDSKQIANAINEKDNHGKTIIDLAIKRKNIEIFNIIFKKLTAEQKADFIKKDQKHEFSLLLCLAIKSNDNELFNIIIEQLTIAQLANIIEKKYDGKTLFQLVAEIGDIEILKSVFKKLVPKAFANVISKDSEFGYEDVLRLAVGIGNITVFEIVSARLTDDRMFEVASLSRKRDGRNLFHFIAVHHNVQAINYILSRLDYKQTFEIINQVDINDKTVFELAAENGDAEIFDVIIAQLTQEQVIKAINKKNEYDSATLLHLAVKGRNIKVINSIFDSLANDQLIDAVNQKNRNHQTVFRLAVEVGEVEVFNSIFARLTSEEASKVIDENRECSFYELLFIALRGNNDQVFDIIFAKLTAEQISVLINQRGENGQTLLHIAAKSGNLRVFDLIVKKLIPDQAEQLINAIKILDNGHKTALEVAVNNNCKNIRSWYEGLYPVFKYSTPKQRLELESIAYNAATKTTYYDDNEVKCLNTSLACYFLQMVTVNRAKELIRKDKKYGHLFHEWINEIEEIISPGILKKFCGKNIIRFLDVQAKELSIGQILSTQELFDLIRNNATLINPENVIDSIKRGAVMSATDADGKTIIDLVLGLSDKESSEFLIKTISDAVKLRDGEDAVKKMLSPKSGHVLLGKDDDRKAKYLSPDQKPQTSISNPFISSLCQVKG